MDRRPSERQIAEQLAELYEERFGGKERGRYRISMKQMRALADRKRVPGTLIRKVGEELFELGYVLIDLETFFAILAQGTFRSYRRVSDARLAAWTMPSSPRSTSIQ